MRNKTLLVMAGTVCLVAPSAAQNLFSSSAESLGDFTTVFQTPDNEVRVVDYSNFNVAGTDWSLGEAPRHMGGSASTTGILMRSNFDGVASLTGLNLILGSSPLHISAPQYTLSFDMFVKAPTPGVVAGSTEQTLWGVGRSNATDYIGRNTRTTNGSGAWGWAAGEGGYASEDFSAWRGTTNFGVKTDGSLEAQTAFSAANGYEYIGAPSGAWTTVDIKVDGDNVKIYYNGVLFWDIDGAQTSGYAMIGYEDPFASESAEPFNSWAVIDNVSVDAVPEPATMALLGAGALALARRKRKA